MKHLILITAVVLSSVAGFANEDENEFEKTETKILTISAFLKDMNYNTNNGTYSGEIDQKGYECSISIGKTKQGHEQIVMKVKIGAEVLTHDVVVMKNDKVKAVTFTSGEDYSIDYSWGYAGLNKIRVVNASDAYDYIEIEDGSMKLTCGNWY